MSSAPSASANRRCRRSWGSSTASASTRAISCAPTDGTYKLGIKFVGWHERSDSYFHPFGVIGKPIGNHDFYQCWLKARAQGDTSALQDFSPCNVMAEQGRFFHPAKARNTPIGGANYALHVDALLVAKFLRKYSEERGLKRTEGKVVERHAARRTASSRA